MSLDADNAYRFDLPADLIAQQPPPERRGSRLLVVARGGGVLGCHPFAALTDLLRPGDLLVVNDSRVLPARLAARRADTGGRVELLLLEPAAGAPGAWRALARPTRRLRAGLELHVEAERFEADHRAHGPARLRLLEIGPNGEVVLCGDGAAADLADLAERCGLPPLPPYIRRDQDAADAAMRRDLDRERYQTVYARRDPSGLGSAAAPTAGLHFDEAMLAGLADRSVELARVTLHVGLGTFRAPTAAQIASGRLHAERFSLPASVGAAVSACRRRGGRVVAVGTTSLRVLETVHRLDLPDDAPVGTVREHPDAGSTGPHDLPPEFAGSARREADGWSVGGVTRLFIQPPDQVEAADLLLTNFHLPGSSLLRLVAAFAGERAWRAAYADAINRRLRFFSYGDAMLITPPTGESP